MYPAATQQISRPSAELQAQQARTHRLAVLLRRLHARLDGDSSAAAGDLPLLRLAVLRSLRQHATGERMWPPPCGLPSQTGSGRR